MNILLWIIFGGLAGWLATIIMGQDSAFGMVGNIIIGIIGAMLGGWIADKAGIGGLPGAERPSSSIWSFIIAVLGAVLLLFIVGLIW